MIKQKLDKIANIKINDLISEKATEGADILCALELGDKYGRGEKAEKKFKKDFPNANSLKKFKFVSSKPVNYKDVWNMTMDFFELEDD